MATQTIADSAEQYLTLREASAYSRLGERTLRRMIDEGRLPALKPLKRLLIRRRELDQFLQVPASTAK
jgi:excisionase family DNA binding protein